MSPFLPPIYPFSTPGFVSFPHSGHRPEAGAPGSAMGITVPDREGKPEGPNT